MSKDTPIDRKARNAALEELRQRKFEDLEKVYEAMMGIVTSAESEDKDKINAAKTAAQILGVARPAQERPAAGPVAPTTDTAPAPALAPDVEARIKAIIGK
jgi:hypothetical protein